MSEKRTVKLSRVRVAIIAALIALVACLATIVVLYACDIISFKSGDDISTEQLERRAGDIKTKVEKLMDLPAEDASIAVATNADEMKKQPFFAGVENGDVVLIFLSSHKAVIYRESTHRIINSGPIAVSEAEDALEMNGVTE